MKTLMRWPGRSHRAAFRPMRRFRTWKAMRRKKIPRQITSRAARAIFSTSRVTARLPSGLGKAGETYETVVNIG